MSRLPLVLLIVAALVGAAALVGLIVEVETDCEDRGGVLVQIMFWYACVDAKPLP